MAKYNERYEVDLTLYNWKFGDDCNGMISVYPNCGLEKVFVNEPSFEENVYIYLNLYYEDDNTTNLIFKSLELEINGIESEVICTEEEVKMFNELLKKML